MVIHKKKGIDKRLIKESIRYIREGKQGYTRADIITYRMKLGKAWTDRKKRRSWLKIGIGGVLCAVGVVTLWFPSGSWFLIGAGCSLMVEGGLDLWKHYRRAERKVDLFLFKRGLR